MKTRSQRILSLVLVLVMLVTMIPAGIFSANAAVSAELEAGLAAYDSTTEFVINNIDDWTAISAFNKNFAGKTVKLGADIDAQGATLPQLFMAANPQATFDGNGYTIKNVGTKEAPNTTSLFSNKSCLNLKNVKVDNVHVNGTGNRGILIDWQNAWHKYTFQNITVTNSSVVAAGYAGAVIGYMTGNGGGYGVDFENIKVSGCSVEGNAGVAALVGYTYLNASDYGATAKNIEVVGTTITDNTAASCAAGLFGYFRHHTGSILSIENAYVEATFKTPNSSGWTGVNTALFQTGNTSTAHVITMKNCLTNVTTSGIVQSTSLCYAPQATFVVENVWHVKNPGKSGMLINGGNKVNGVTTASNYNAILPETVAAAMVSHMITRDANGYISNIAMPTGLALDLINYASASTFVIKSVEDWEMVAASGKNFSGKTVQLGNDIDAKGATLSTISPLAAGNSEIIFDGNGYAIKNVGTADAPQTKPLISEKLSGFVVKDVTFQNITMVGGGATYGIGLICDFVSGWGTHSIHNVKVLGCDITSTAGPVGALLGRIVANDEKVVTDIDGVIIDAETTITGALHAGGVVGHFSGNGGSHNINRVYTAATVSAPASAGYTGGLAGYVQGNAGFAISEFNFTNNVVRGQLYAIDGSSWTGRVGAICGRATTAVNLNVYNNIMAPTAVTSGLVLCQAITAANGAQNVNVDNCYNAQVFISMYYAENSSSTLYGAAKASGHWYNAGVPAVINLGKGADLEDKIAKLYTTDNDGFVVAVKDHIDAEAVQYSAVSGGTYAVRFIAFSQLTGEQATDVNMVVIANVKDANGNVIQRVKFDSAKSETGECVLYDGLTVYSEMGIKENAKASDYGVAKLAGFTVYGIPTGNAITFEVTTSYVDANGHVATGANTMLVNFDATGALIK